MGWASRLRTRGGSHEPLLVSHINEFENKGLSLTCHPAALLRLLRNALSHHFPRSINLRQIHDYNGNTFSHI